MLVNSISHRALREDIRAAFERRGYAEDTERPDVVVAVYATAKSKLDVTTWDYGYPWRPRWGGLRGPRTYTTVTEYTEGTVIIDVLQASTRDLLWRGEGVSAVPDDQQSYIRELGHTVDQVVERFPSRR